MHRTYKSRISRGAFTLLEMVLVVAIIIIIASALLTGVSRFINGANNANNIVAGDAKNIEKSYHASEQKLADYDF